MNSKLLFSSLVVGGGSVAAGGYGVYLATIPSFNPLEVAEKIVETTKSLQKTFKDLKDAKTKFLKTVEAQNDNKDDEEGDTVRDQEDNDPEKTFNK